MSTRATYEICGTTFYCHYDGYPTGAAERFAEMVKALTVAGDRHSTPIEDRRGGFTYAFIRGALDAEPTDGHDAHGDTEYRYTLTAQPTGEATIVVDEREAFAEWKQNYRSDLADWLNFVREGDLVKQIKRIQARYPDGIMSCPGDPFLLALEHIPVIVRVEEQSPYSKSPSFTYATVEQATNIKDLLLEYADSFQSNNPNKKVYADRGNAWAQAVIAGLKQMRRAA